MYVGRQHTATIQTKQVLSFQCVHCHHEANALVVGFGQGQGNSPYFLDEAGAKERAAEASRKAAQKNAELTVRLARCPKCGECDEASVRALKTKTFLGMFAAFAALIFVGLIFSSLRHGGIVLWILVPFAFLAPWGIWRLQSWQWTTVANRVAFLPDDFDRE